MKWQSLIFRDEKKDKPVVRKKDDDEIKDDIIKSCSKFVCANRRSNFGLPHG